VYAAKKISMTKTELVIVNCAITLVKRVVKMENIVVVNNNI